MNRITVDGRAAAGAIGRRLGISLEQTERVEPAGGVLELRPEGIPYTSGFSVEVVFGWRSVESRFVPGPFARDLLSQMEQADRGGFLAFIESARRDGAEVRMTINGVSVDSQTTEGWPSGWRSLSLSMRSGPVVIENQDDAISLAIRWGGRVLGAMMTLLDLEAVEEPGEMEGGAREERHLRYERSPKNRASCIEIHGAKCGICGFDFGATYGSEAEGFIEVHHLIEVSRIEPGTPVNPATDLIPLCSNCHSIVHLRRPALSPEEVRAMLQRTQEKPTGGT